MTLNDSFLKMLEHMTSAFVTSDGFHWTIAHITLYERGPEAQFLYRWRNASPAHDAFACMTLVWNARLNTFELRAETCSMGPETSHAMKALENRLQRAKNFLKRTT